LNLKIQTTKYRVRCTFPDAGALHLMNNQLTSIAEQHTLHQPSRSALHPSVED